MVRFADQKQRTVIHEHLAHGGSRPRFRASETPADARVDFALPARMAAARQGRIGVRTEVELE